MRHTIQTLLWILLISISLSACGQGAVIYAPTPLPPDTSPIAYVHPSGTFQITVPRTWSAFSQYMPDLASASFAMPNSVEPVLTITVLNLVDMPDIATLLNTYQAEVRPDVGRYTETERQAMGDGSWRLIGFRTSIGGVGQAVNTFIQTYGTVISISDIILTQSDNPTLWRTLEEAVNSLQVISPSSLSPTTLYHAQKTATNPLRLTTVHIWTTRTGVMFITGMIQNASDMPIGGVPIYAGITNGDGAVVKGESGQVLGYAIPANGFMPFSLRFGDGRPIDAQNYTITLGGGGWNPLSTTPRYYGEAYFTVNSQRTDTPEGTVIIRGEVTHIGTNIVRDPMAVVTIYDNQRRVIATGFTLIKEGVFMPQAVAEFSFNITELGGTPTFHLVTVQALPEIP